MRRIRGFFFIAVSLSATTLSLDFNQAQLDDRARYCSWLDRRLGVDPSAEEPTQWNTKIRKAITGLPEELYARLWSLDHQLENLRSRALIYELPPSLEMAAIRRVAEIHAELAQLDQELRVLDDNRNHWQRFQGGDDEMNRLSADKVKRELPAQISDLRSRRNRAAEQLADFKVRRFKSSDIQDLMKIAQDLGPMPRLSLLIEADSLFGMRSAKLTPAWQEASGEWHKATDEPLLKVSGSMVPKELVAFAAGKSESELLSTYRGLAGLLNESQQATVQRIAPGKIVISAAAPAMHTQLSNMSVNALLDLGCLRDSQAIQARLEDLENSLKRDGVLENQLDENSRTALKLIRRVAVLRSTPRKSTSTDGLTADSRF